MPAVKPVCRPFAALLLCGACGLGPAGSDEDRVPLARTSQPAIEDLATRKPFPRYPAASLGNGTAGVAVASILIGFDGRMERVDVLEAPDPHVADAVRDALGQWVLPPIRFDHNPGVPYKGMATMVFYFLIEEGEGRVVSGPVLAAERSTADPADDRPADDRPADDRPRRIDDAELRELLETADPVLVDPRARDLYAQGHRDGAVNIPERELQSRAAIELPHSRPVVVDCRRGSESMCDVAARVLQRVGFPEVAVFVSD